MGKWHMSTRMGDVKTCSNSEDFSTAWLDNATIFLHATGEVCCLKMFGGDPSCRVDDRCTELNQVTQDEADQAGGGTQGDGSSNDCPALKWHLVTTEEMTCSNSGGFPAAWLNNPQLFLHATGELCCQKMFVGRECEIRDVCTDTGEGNRRKRGIYRDKINDKYSVPGGRCCPKFDTAHQSTCRLGSLVQIESRHFHAI